MKLSTRSTYGMRALVELALASGRGPVSAASIARRQNLSVAYLEQLLHRLKRQGLVSSIRGPRGGYVLAKTPQQITMAEVVEVLDGGNGYGKGRGVPKGGAPNGALRPSRQQQETGRGGGHRPACAAPGKRGGSAAGRHAQRIAQAVWRCVHERLTQSLGAVTLQDLSDEVRASAGEPLDHRYVFHI